MKFPFDINYSPDLCFTTDLRLSDKFPKTVGHGNLIIGVPINLANRAFIVDDCLLQFDGFGQMYALDIPANALYVYDLTKQQQDLSVWLNKAALASSQMIDAIKRNEGAVSWLQLYTIILTYHTTHEVSEGTYTAALHQLRKGFRFAPSDETIRISNRQWYYGSERKTWGNIALNIFRDYFKGFITY